MRMIRTGLGAVALMGLLASGPSMAGIITKTINGGAIPDGNASGANFDFTISSSEIVSLTGDNVTLTLTGIVQTWIGDLVATLTHVNTGTSAVIFNRPGGVNNSDNFNGGTYKFNDAYTGNLGAVAGSNVPSGNYAPLQSFDVFNGESAGGTWRLNIKDLVSVDVANSSWTTTLNLVTSVKKSVPEPSLWMLCLTGLLAAGLLRRRRADT